MIASRGSSLVNWCCSPRKLLLSQPPPTRSPDDLSLRWRRCTGLVSTHNFFIGSLKSWLPLYRLPRHWPSVTVTGRPWLASQVAAMLCGACAGEGGSVARRRERPGPGRLLPGPCRFVSSLLGFKAASVGKIAESARINGETIRLRTPKAGSTEAQVSCRDPCSGLPSGIGACITAAFLVHFMVPGTERTRAGLAYRSPSVSPPAVLHGQRAAWMQTVGQVRQRHHGLRAGPHSDPSSPPFGAGVAAAGGSPSPCTPENGYLPLGAEYDGTGTNVD